MLIYYSNMNTLRYFTFSRRSYFILKLDKRWCGLIYCHAQSVCDGENRLKNIFKQYACLIFQFTFIGVVLFTKEYCLKALYWHSKAQAPKSMPKGDRKEKQGKTPLMKQEEAMGGSWLKGHPPLADTGQAKLKGWWYNTIQAYEVAIRS